MQLYWLSKDLDRLNLCFRWNFREDFDTKKYNVHLDEKKITVETWHVTNERNSLKCG